jgi:drug/metabolite transporter (DMT)-like permease
MFALLAMGSAALYGAADFIGGLTSRRADTISVVVISQAAGLVVVALVVAALGLPVPAYRDWLWGAIAGLAGGGGVALLYRALAVGVMSLVAPVTAVCAVAVPVIVLVSRGADAPDSHEQPRRGLGLAVASGVAIGLFFLALARTSPDAGMWPLLFARISSVVLFAALMVATGKRLSMPRPTMALAITGGILDMLANVLYLLATRYGPLTLVVTLSSLYPASTVLLARFVLHERLTRWQWVGVALSLIAIGLIVTE